MISSTDHLPVVINLDIKIKKDKSKFKHKVTKRSFKNFTTEAWNESLERKDWSPIYSSNTVDEMVDVFQKNIEEALNDIAPVKTFTIRSNYKFGLCIQISIEYNGENSMLTTILISCAVNLLF